MAQFSEAVRPHFDRARWHTETEDYWPRRLLHIATMTSHERTGRGTYGTTGFPRYSILSYTWGRWQVDDEGEEQERDSRGGHRALPVLGTTWAIPRVDEAHFTVEAFQRVVYQMSKSLNNEEQDAEKIEWAWIDIACIDQEDEAVKMDEVGRQVSIFRNAARAYVWFSRTSNDALGGAMYVIKKAGGDFSFNPWGREDVEAPSLGALRVLRDAIATVLEDPWFSSLWTLQELMMRNDAVILGREASVVGGEASLTNDVEYLMVCCANILKEAIRTTEGEPAGSRNPDDLEPEVRDVLADIVNRIYRSGITAALDTSNPNMLYGVAQFRQTRYPEDRIYGIMQIYDVRVGLSVRPFEPRPPPDMLRAEFGLAINARSAVRGQLFVHTMAAPVWSSWCVTEGSGVPSWLKRLEGVRDRCTIGMKEIGDSGTFPSVKADLEVRAIGPCCAFTRFYEASLAAGSAAILEIFLDHETNEYVGNSVDTGDRTFRRYGIWRDPDAWQALGAMLLEHLDPERLTVMLLGESSIAVPRLEGGWGQYHGLLLLRVGEEPRPATYMRLGLVCCRRNIMIPEEEASRFPGAHAVFRDAQPAQVSWFHSLDELFSTEDDLILV